MKELFAEHWTINSSIGSGEARYASKEEAVRVACSLAKLHVGKDFYVMQSVSVSYAEDVPVETRSYVVC